MRRMRLHFAIPLLLTAAVVFLCACGRTSFPTSPAEERSLPAMPARSTGDAAAESDPAVYTAAYTPISGNDGRLLAVNLFTDRGFYTLSDDKTVIEQVIPPEETENGGEEPDGGEGENDTPQTRLVELWEKNLYFTDYTGSTSRCVKYSPFAPETEEGHDSRVYLTGMDVMPDGNIAMVCVLNESWDGSPEGTKKYSDLYYDYLQSSYRVFLRIIDAKGREKELTELSVPMNVPGAKRSAFCPTAMCTDGEGNVVIGGGNAVFVYDRRGELLCMFDLPEKLSALLRFPDGRAAAIIGNTAADRTLCAFDLRDMGLNVLADIPEKAVCVIPGAEDDLCYTVGTELYGMDADSGTSRVILNWVDCGVAPGDLGRCAVLSDGTVVNVLNMVNGEDLTPMPGIMTAAKVRDGEGDKRQILTLAAAQADEALCRTVIAYNRRSTEYRVVLNDYSRYNTASRSDAGLARLKADVLAENAGDMVWLEGLPYEQLAGAGLFDDLYPYLEADKELDASMLLPNVRAHLETDGCLCRTCSGFTVETAAVPVKYAGSVTVTDWYSALSYLEEMPDDSAIGDRYLTAADVLKKILRADLGLYFDAENRAFGFDSDEFRELLYFARRFPARTDESGYSAYNEPYTRAHRGRQVYLDCVIRSPIDVSRVSAVYGKDGAAFTGYPSARGSASLIVTDPGFALCRCCGDKDGAWSFLRTFFTEEYQSGLHSIPTNIRLFDAQLEAASTPEYILDEDGEILYDEETDEPLTVSLGNMNLMNGDVVRWYALTDEQAETYRRLAAETEKFACDEGVIGMIASLCSDCFNDVLSVDYTASLVQRRITALFG